MTPRVLCSGILVLLAAFACAAQDRLPDKIDGYKVYRAKVLVTRETDPKTDADVIVILGEPSILKIGFSGVAANLSGTVTSKRSGKIERLLFRDFTVNGTSVNIVEDAEPLAVKTSGTSFQRRIEVSLGPVGAAKAAYRELTDPKADWNIRGTIFAFGRFDRFGMKFKRVVPVPVAIAVKNPLR